MTNNGDPFSFANLTTTFITLDPLVQDHVYEVRVRAFNVVGAGEWTDPQRVFTFRDGECADDANAEVWNANQGTFSADMADCCGGCLGLRGCFVNCWAARLPYSEGCTGCWGDTCACSTVNCLIPCLGGNPAACDQCVIENCNPTTEACSGVPGEFIPRG